MSPNSPFVPSVRPHPPASSRPNTDRFEEADDRYARAAVEGNPPDPETLTESFVGSPRDASAEQLAEAAVVDA